MESKLRPIALARCGWLTLMILEPLLLVPFEHAHDFRHEGLQMKDCFLTHA